MTAEEFVGPLDWLTSSRGRCWPPRGFTTRGAAER